MKVLIVSDTHRHNDNLNKVLRKVKPLDMVIHCGDAEGTEDEIRMESECPLYIISGNNDFFSLLSKEIELSIENYKAFITHGHMYGVSMGLERLVEEAKLRLADIVMFGHTHRPMIDIRDDLVILNPGSLSYPRQDGKFPTYILMEIDKYGDAHYTLEYLDTTL